VTRVLKKRIILLANNHKPQVRSALDDLRLWLADRAEIVAEPNIDKPNDYPDLEQWPDADFAIILGGDGTILGLARAIVDLQLPIIGVNFGMLGFLADFSIADLKTHWDSIMNGQCPTSSRTMLLARVLDSQAPDVTHGKISQKHIRYQSLALNEAVITNGAPFRMIDLELSIAPGLYNSGTTKFSGDGVIIATPSGSTAYNLSAGGSIISPGLDVLAITPICPHSLSFRPIIIDSDAIVSIGCLRLNQGTTLVLDGQKYTNLHPEEQVCITKYEKELKLIHNPSLPYWEKLASKMHWASSPLNHTTK